MKRGMASAQLRLFTIQAAWNFERLLGVGLGFCVEPLLRDLPGGTGGTHYHAALGRASGYFNAHPYLAGIAAGAIARAEHDGLPAGQVDRLRTALLGPLGSVGDRLVWAGTLPAALGVALILAATAAVGVAAGVFLLLHAAVHLPLRIWSLRAGWRLGPRVARALGGPVLTRALDVVGPLAALSMGVALPVVGTWIGSGFAPPAQVAIAVVAVVVVLMVRVLVPRLGGVRLGLMAVALALLGGWV